MQGYVRIRKRDLVSRKKSRARPTRLPDPVCILGSYEVLVQFPGTAPRPCMLVGLGFWRSAPHHPQKAGNQRTDRSLAAGGIGFEFPGADRQRQVDSIFCGTIFRPVGVQA